MSLASSGFSRYSSKRDMTSTPRSHIPQRVQSQPRSANIQSQKPRSIASIRRTAGPFPPTGCNRPDKSAQNSSVKIPSYTKRTPSARPLRNISITPKNNGKSNSFCYPNQATLKKEEDYEVQQGQLSYDDFEALQTKLSPEVRESVSSLRGNLVKLKICWQEQMEEFGRLKAELGLRQKEVMRLYIAICKTHRELLATGLKAVLPPPEELSIMNVAKLSPDQLLQMCADADREQTKPADYNKVSHTESLTVNKFHDVSMKLVCTCKQAMEKKNDLIDWFDKLMHAPDCKGINKNVFNEKMIEFNAENNKLKKCLENVRSEFDSEMKVIMEEFRQTVNDAISNQLKAETLTCQVSKLRAENNDLTKTLHSLENTKINKMKIDELVKEVKEEKSRAGYFQEQVAIGESQLMKKEEEVERLKEHASGLEQTIQELNDQNQQLQENFDKELNTLMASITKNTENLKEIATAREKLQSEKENIERRYKEQIDQYTEEIKKIKQELQLEIEKRAEIDGRYLDMIEKRKLLESMVDTLQKQLKRRDIESNNKTKIFEEEISSIKEKHEQLEKQKQRELDDVKKEIANYKTVIQTQNNNIHRLEQVEKDMMKKLEETKEALTMRNQYIANLESKQSFLEDQLRQSESKLSSYEDQLAKIKHDINSIQDAWGYFENFEELSEKMNQQRLKISEATERNRVLSAELEKKENDLKTIKEKLERQVVELNEKEAAIKSLMDKDEEHKNVIQLMKETFEMRTETDAKLNRELNEKDVEINTLINALEASKEQVNQLKKIVFTVKEQAAKQKQSDQEIIILLERRLADVDSENRQGNSNSDDFENLIRNLEDELQTPFKYDERSIENRRNPKKRANKEKRSRHEKYCREQSPSSLFDTDGPKATKIVMGNFVKKTYISNNQEDDNDSEDLDRKKAITNMETQRWIPLRGTGIGAYQPSVLKDNRNETYNGLGHIEEIKEKYLSRNLPFVITSPLQEEKQSRMFRFAKHRM